MRFLTSFLMGTVKLFGLLVLEVLLAMAIYMYLATNHVGLFGEMVRWARDVLNLLLDTLEMLLPNLSGAAFASLAGEIGPKSFLLLVLGLFASGLMRVVLWSGNRVRAQISDE